MKAHLSLSLQDVQALPEFGFHGQLGILELSVELGQLGLERVELRVATLDDPVKVFPVFTLRRDVNTLNVDDKDKTGFTALALHTRCCKNFFL